MIRNCLTCCIPGEWTAVTPLLYDNVAEAMLALFQLSTLEGWTDQMYACVDCNGIDMQPIINNNVMWIYFYIVFIMVGAFFVIPL